MESKDILTLSGKNLKCAAMPLGGIGTGTIAIGGDGLLKQWQISNTVKHNAFVPNSFFGIWTQKQGETTENPISRALFCSNVHDDPDFEPVPSVSDHKLPRGAQDMFEILPGVEEIKFTGEYPIAFLDYIDESIPLNIKLTAYNPFIPLDPKNSGLPLIVFNFQITNKSSHSQEVSLIGSFLNFLGWDGIKVLKGTTKDLFGGNVNMQRNVRDWNALYMKSKILQKTDTRYGDLTFGINKSDSMIIAQWDDLKQFWDHFSKKGVLPDSDSKDMSDVGNTWVGSLGYKKTLNPGESMEVRFFFTWNFPNRVVDWIIDKEQIPDDNTEFWVGNRYNEWFKNSKSVLKYVNNNWDNLKQKTESFHEIFFSATLPPEIITSISATMSIIRTPSCFWIKDGSFHGFEGCHGASTWSISGGCCPLDCTHVWTYEFSLAHLYPTLERTIRETEFQIQHESGYVPHRIVLPLYLPQLQKEGNWDVMGPAIDGMFSSILRIYRDFLITGDRDFLKKSWNYIENLMNYIFKNSDEDLNGVIYNAQPNTCDCIIYGINSFIGSLYLTTLLTCEKIALELDFPTEAKKYRKIYESGRKILDKECWNGEYGYYIQKYDKERYKKHQYGIGCHCDQLIGQWWAFQLGFGYILPQEHVDKTLRSIVHNNFKENFKEIEMFRVFASPEDQGLINCTWPFNEKPSEPIRYGNEVWTGIEYEVAALCAEIGELDDTLKIVRAIRERYNGTHRNPWNEVECGDHYVRAMSSWTLLKAITGIEFNINTREFQIRPKINSEDFSSFFITNNAWGKTVLSRKRDKLFFSLSPFYGKIEVKRVVLPSNEREMLKNGKFCLKSTSKEIIQTFKGRIIESNKESTVAIEFEAFIEVNESEGLFIELE